MASFQRDHVATLVRRLAEPPHFIIALFGPRQTGKTTIVRQALRRIDRRSLYLAVDEPDPRALGIPSVMSATTLRRPQVRDTEWLVLNWEHARREAERSPNGSVLVLDEIQRIPQWSETVKGLWDADRAADRPLHVVILGSSPLLMQSGLTESLAGRFEPIRVTHWSFLEMANAFGLDLPGFLILWWLSGIRLAVSGSGAVARLHPARARRAEHRARLAGDDPRGQAGAAEAAVRTGGELLRPRFSLTRRCWDSFRMPATALMTAGSGYTFEEARADRTFWGRIVESAVGAHLLNTATSDIRVYYWRDGQHEVDFVLRRGPRLVGIEVKSGPRRGSLSGLQDFAERFGPQRTLVVGEDGVPLNEFLAAPAGYWCEEA